METKPYETITVTDIVRKSGVCRASFYRNYSDKEDVLRNYIKYAMKCCPEYYSEQENTDMEAQVRSVCKTILENRRLFDALKQNQLLYFLHEQILDVVNGHIRRQKIHMDHYEVAFLSHAALGILLEWIYNGYQENEEEMAKLLLKLLRMPVWQ